MSIVIRNDRFVEKEERYVEIYKITCLNSGKCYVGQAVSHILNHGKYRRYGMKKRFNCHVSEAFSGDDAACHAFPRFCLLGFQGFLKDTRGVGSRSSIEDKSVVFLSPLASFTTKGTMVFLGV